MAYYGWSIRDLNLMAQGQCHLSSEMETTSSSNIKRTLQLVFPRLLQIFTVVIRGFQESKLMHRMFIYGF